MYPEGMERPVDSRPRWDFAAQIRKDQTSSEDKSRALARMYLTQAMDFGAAGKPVEATAAATIALAIMAVEK